MENSKAINIKHTSHSDDPPAIEPLLIDSDELARMLSVTKRFIVKHRNKIAGAVKIGGVWRFKLSDIRMRIATGKDIFVK